MLPEVTDFCRLVLIRHPELHADHAGCAVGAGAAALSRRGRARVLRWIELLEPLQIDRVVSSDQPQASEPAKALAKARGLEVEVEPRLRDQGMGAWQGRPWQDLVDENAEAVRRFFESFAEVVPPDGESLGQAVERVLAWWAEAGPAAAGKTLAVVAAGSVLSGFAAAMLGMRLSRCISLHLPHGAVAVLEVFANGTRIACWNPEALAE